MTWFHGDFHNKGKKDTRVAMSVKDILDNVKDDDKEYRCTCGYKGNSLCKYCERKENNYYKQ